MNQLKPRVFVIDDDAAMRKSVARLLASYSDYESETFASASDFLALPPYPGPSCVIVDVQMPGLDGLEFQQALINRRREEQLIFISGHGNVPMCAQVMKAGAIDFLPKPFKPAELISCVKCALERSEQQRKGANQKADARALLDLLTPREFQVLELVVQGLMNKQIAAELGMAEQTAKVHRGRVTRKLGLASAVELARLVERAGMAKPLADSTKV
jgi:FixJ family two-component response regulator